MRTEQTFSTKVFRSVKYQPAPGAPLGNELRGKALAGVGKFKPPTLRNIAVAAPYMHDGSIATLEDVIDRYAAGGRTIASGANTGIGNDNPNPYYFLGGFQLSKRIARISLPSCSARNQLPGTIDEAGTKVGVLFRVPYPRATYTAHGLRQMSEYRKNRRRCKAAPGSMLLQTVRISSNVSPGGPQYHAPGRARSLPACHRASRVFRTAPTPASMGGGAVSQPL